MKTSDVEVGKTYLCRAGEKLVRVRVTERIEGRIRSGSGRKEPDRFRVRKEGASQDLPGLRSGPSLRVLPTLDADFGKRLTVLFIRMNHELHEQNNEPPEKRSSTEFTLQDIRDLHWAIGNVLSGTDESTCHQCGHTIWDHIAVGCLTVDCHCGVYKSR
jgi:hypothetical protein